MPPKKCRIGILRHHLRYIGLGIVVKIALVLNTTKAILTTRTQSKPYVPKVMRQNSNSAVFFWIESFIDPVTKSLDGMTVPGQLTKETFLFFERKRWLPSAQR